MNNHDSAAEANGSAGFAEIRETLRQVGELLRETEARAAENEARAAENEARAAENEARAARATAELKEQLKEQAREADRRMKETDRQMRETDRRLKKAEGLFTSQWGKLMESLVRGDLVALLNARGIEVEKTHQGIEGSRNGQHYEIDLLAVNGREVVVVEVKTTLRTESVTKFLSKLSVFLDWCPEYRGKRIFGAVAYLKGAESVTTYAERRGLFVIRATGSSASIVNGPDFKPHAFG